MSVAVAANKTGRWLADPGFGAYVHIPFCRHRCHYCDFNTYEGQDDLHSAYVDALIADIHRTEGSRPATSVFFGGGTPTLLEPRDLGRILASIDVAPGAEVTVEANPETIDAGKLEGLLAAGFNRISIGVQSLADHVLSGLGRTHSAATALDAVAAARRAGFADINVDLIYGSAWEKPEDWEHSLEGVVAAGPDHVSAYALTIEEGTPLATLIRTGRVPDVDPDVQAERHEIAESTLGAAGYERYEVSNWARPGHTCAHNIVYWSAGDYLGFGAGAHGHIGGRRAWATRLPREFIAAVAEDRSTEDGHEVVRGDERVGEALMLGLRLASGIDLPSWTARWGPDYLDEREPVLAGLEAGGLIERTPDNLHIAPRATFLLNEVLTRLMP